MSSTLGEARPLDDDPASRPVMLRTPLALLAGVLLAVPAPAAGRQVPPESPREYTVSEGDTLWSLARRLLGDPQRWPELVEANQDRISGPEDLEAGMILVVPVEATGSDASTPARVAVVTVPAEAPAPAPDSAAPVPVRRADAVEPPAGEDRPPVRTPFYRATPGDARPDAPSRASAAPPRAIPPGLHAAAPFLVPAAATDTAPASLAASDDAVRSARVGDRLVVEGSGDLLREGLELQSFRRLPRRVGGERIAIPTGLLRVESAGPDRAVVAVLRSFDRLTPGDRVRRLPPAPEDGRADTAPSGVDLRTVLLDSALPRGVLTPGDWVFLAAGRVHGVRPGDEFVPAAPADDLRAGGRLQVVLVQDSTSTARVVAVGARLLRVGAAVRLDRRLR